MTQGAKFSSEPTTRILVVDDHPLVRDGLATRIASQPDMEVCGEADCVRDALAQVKATSPDVAIADIQLVESHGIDLIEQIDRRFPSVKMLVVSVFDESLYAERALRAGAHGYINKRELQDNVIHVIRTILQGEHYLSSKMAQQLLRRAVGSKHPVETDPIQRLSNRELEVFRLIGEGKTTAAIAQRLHLSTHTIDTHREKIRHKLEVKNSAELMQRAVQWVLENP